MEFIAPNSSMLLNLPMQQSTQTWPYLLSLATRALFLNLLLPSNSSGLLIGFIPSKVASPSSHMWESIAYGGTSSIKSLAFWFWHHTTSYWQMRCYQDSLFLSASYLQSGITLFSSRNKVQKRVCASIEYKLGGEEKFQYDCCATANGRSHVFE